MNNSINWRITWWLRRIPQYVVFVLFILGAMVVLNADFGLLPLLLGAYVFYLCRLLIQMILLSFNIQGLRLVRRQRYADAIERFQRSYDFFSKYVWIDLFRSLILLTSLEWSYREVALINIAHCYSELGDVPQVKACYERLQTEFPKNTAARSMLNLIHAVETWQTKPAED